MKFQPRLLWFDSLAGLSVGVAMLVVSIWLAEWYRLPIVLVLGIALANVAYGSFSLSLALRQSRSLTLIAILAIANVVWGANCFLLVFIWRDAISWIGVAHLVGEGIFVGGLGIVEWRFRNSLR